MPKDSTITNTMWRERELEITKEFGSAMRSAIVSVSCQLTAIYIPTVLQVERFWVESGREDGNKLEGSPGGLK
jgi:hypothetical protein